MYEHIILRKSGGAEHILSSENVADIKVSTTCISKIKKLQRKFYKLYYGDKKYKEREKKMAGCVENMKKLLDDLPNIDCIHETAKKMCEVRVSEGTDY